MTGISTAELPTRRDIVLRWFGAASVAAASVAAGAWSEAVAQASPTPSCGDGDLATPRQTEGPFYRPQNPARRSFRGDAEGEPFSLVGLVTDTRCRPIEGALVDLWHADADGAYDLRGTRLRGHQLTDQRGRYAFETIAPGAYPGRTRHFHVKVRPPEGRILTTQLYFPGEPSNLRDAIYDPRLQMRMERARDGQFGRFDFVLRIA